MILPGSKRDLDPSVIRIFYMTIVALYMILKEVYNQSIVAVIVADLLLTLVRFMFAFEKK
jgi:hypothetical protein